MKKLVTLLTVLLFTASLIQAQALKDSWSLGFGGALYHGTSINSMPRALKSFGGYLSLQRSFTEHSGLRLALDFGSLTNSPSGQSGKDITNTSLAGNIAYVYTFMPCETLSPFATVGAGINSYSVDMSDVVGVSDIDDAAIQIGVSFGMLANLNDNWKIKAELGNYTVLSTDFDGVGGTTGYGVLGSNSDAYMKFDIGAEWYFSKGEPSKICQLYDGLEVPDPVDYERLENIVKKYIPREVIKEVVVTKEVSGSGGMVNNNMVLMGVNYDFSSNRLKPEAYPILYHTANVMKQNPSVDIEVQGYTDNIGSEKSNKALSQRRADSVKSYLIARGIDASRVKAVGYGESNPMGDNKDAAGRAMNRRIEFKVLD